MQLAISPLSLDGPNGAPNAGAPTFTVSPTSDGQLVAQDSAGLYRAVDPFGNVIIHACPDGPGDYEKFILDGAVAVYRPRRDLADSNAYRYAATKVPGGG